MGKSRTGCRPSSTVVPRRARWVLSAPTLVARRSASAHAIARGNPSRFPFFLLFIPTHQHHDQSEEIPYEELRMYKPSNTSERLQRQMRLPRSLEAIPVKLGAIFAPGRYALLGAFFFALFE